MTEDETVGWHHRHKGHEFEKDRGARSAAVHGATKSQTRLRLNENNNKNVLFEEGVMLIPSSQSGLVINHRISTACLENVSHPSY